MKKLLLITAFLCVATLQSQTLQEIYSKHITPTSNAYELQEGLNKLDSLCAASPQDKCIKAKATGLYLLSDRYYQAGYETYTVDRELSKPILTKAEVIYNQAYILMPLEDFPDYNINIMTESKAKFEAYLEYNVN